MCKWKLLGTLRLGTLNMCDMGHRQIIMKLMLELVNSDKKSAEFSTDSNTVSDGWVGTDLELMSML